MPTKKRKSQVDRSFSRWFEDQFGKRPGGSVATTKLCQEVDQVVNVYIRARRMQDMRLAWEHKREITFKAWLAKEAEDVRQRGAGGS